MKQNKPKLENGDRVRTKTHAVYQDTQESLSDLTGTIVDNSDFPYNLHVQLDNKPHFNGPVGFSEFELTKID
jgi:hypothetical protein